MALPDLAVGAELDSDLLNALPKGVVYQGNRTSTKSGVTTEDGVLRIDGMTLLNGRTYFVIVGNIRPALTTQTDRAIFKLHYNSAGTAVNASPEIGRTEFINSANLNVSSLAQTTGWINPTADTSTGSVLFTIARSGVGTISLPPDTGGLWLTVIDYGIAVADTGIDL
jgi:hypothetical protein